MRASRKQAAPARNDQSGSAKVFASLLDKVRR